MLGGGGVDFFKIKDAGSSWRILSVPKYVIINLK